MGQRYAGCSIGDTGHRSLRIAWDIEDVQIDSPKGREVLAQVKASDLCHTDHYMAVNPFGFPLPALLGHELVWVVSEIGPDVREFAVGG